jgi:chlorite dismutase
MPSRRIRQEVDLLLKKSRRNLSEAQEIQRKLESTVMQINRVIAHDRLSKRKPPK